MDSSNNDTATKLSNNNRVVLHEVMLNVTFNNFMRSLTVQLKPGKADLCKRALQEEFKDYELLCIVDGNTLHVGVKANSNGDLNHTKLHDELTDLLVSPERKQPSSIDDIHINRRLTSIVKELDERAFSEIICMNSEFIEGFYLLSRFYRDAIALLKDEVLQNTCLEHHLFDADDYDTLAERMEQKKVVVVAVCVNEMNEELQELYPHHPAPIDLEIIGDLARSEAVGKGAAYFHPTPGTDAFLMYYSWRFHEPIPVEDVQSITALFKQLSDLGLPPTKCFLELRELGEDSVFTVFSPKYEEWFEHIWD